MKRIAFFVAYGGMWPTLNFEIIWLALITFKSETPGSTTSGFSNYINLRTFGLKKTGKYVYYSRGI
jgi:hypothetical protein